MSRLLNSKADLVLKEHHEQIEPLQSLGVEGLFDALAASHLVNLLRSKNLLIQDCLRGDHMSFSRPEHGKDFIAVYTFYGILKSALFLKFPIALLVFVYWYGLYRLWKDKGTSPITLGILIVSSGAYMLLLNPLLLTAAFWLIEALLLVFNRRIAVSIVTLLLLLEVQTGIERAKNDKVSSAFEAMTERLENNCNKTKIIKKFNGPKPESHAAAPSE